MRLPPDIAAAIANDALLTADVEALCSFGGRLAGTEGERRAIDALARRGLRATGVPCRLLPVPYAGWTGHGSDIRLADGTVAPCHALVRSVATPPDGLRAEVLDLGRGTPEEFEAHRADIVGRIVLVRHEAMFVAGTIHRRRKYEMARAAGAVGFLIAGPAAGSLVAGSSGRGPGEPGIPAAGIAPETASRLGRTAAGWPVATLSVRASEHDAETQTLLFDLPGREPRWVVLSAHLDGHDLAESAIDNASGVAAALAVARALAPSVAGWPCGLRLAFFSVEEWALTGSARYVADLDGEERDAIALNVNLDSIGFSPALAALTSGFAGLEPFLLAVAEANDVTLRCVRPVLANSDHANFAAAGIPAFRLVAGYDDPEARSRHVLTARDTLDQVTAPELRLATRLAAAIVAAACRQDGEAARAWRSQHREPPARMT